MEISVTQQALLYLLNCAVNERVPEELPEELDFKELYKLSKFHSVSAMVSYALDRGKYLTEAYMSQEMIQKWAAARIGAIRKNLMFDAEREQILQWMEEVGCWYMPLKGVILKDMYPDVGMREMCDNDILFDKKFRKQLKEYMVGRGYEVRSFEKQVHDVYVKPPFFNFEVHSELFSESSRENWYDYYTNIKNILQKDSNNQLGYHFSNEDFYIYIMAHAYKHYKEAGTGIRSFVDTYVYLKKKKDRMDWEYIKREASRVDIDKFEYESRVLVQKIFHSQNTFRNILPKSDGEVEMLTYILGAGTYGTMKNTVENRFANIGKGKTKKSFNIKFKYCIERLFPGMDYMYKHRPLLCKYKILIPFFWIGRLIYRPFINGKQLIKEIKMLIKMK